MLQRERRMATVCVCEVTAKGAWLLPHKHITQSLFISAPASLSVLGNGICLKSEGNTHYELQLFSVAIKPAEVWWMKDSFNRINCRGTTLRGNDLCVPKAFQLSGAENGKRGQTVPKGGWALTQDQKELSKQNKEDSEMYSKKKIQQKTYQDDSYFDNSLKEKLLIQADNSWRVRAERAQPALRFMAVTHRHSRCAGKLCLTQWRSLNGKPQ